MSLSTEPYKGVRDFYPEDWARLASAFDTVRTTLHTWGYQEYQASPLEPSELYESKGSEEIVREQTFTFEDRGGRRVTLRPEMTPTLARLVAQKRRELAFPLRWFSIGNRFRYERPQRGRLREFFQVDVDLIGLPAGEADVEIITLASQIVQAFGAKEEDFAIRINSRSLLKAACRAAGLTDEEAAREYWRLVDRRSKISAKEFEQERAKFPADPLAIVEEAADPEVAREKQAVMALIGALRERGITNVSFDPEIVRGFDYYTGMVFEVNDTNPINPRALYGGGRYDGLVSLFGGDPIPAVGFAMGDVTLLDFLETHDLLPEVNAAPQLYIGTPTEDDIPAAQAFAKTLRARGVRTFVNLTGKSLGDQVKDAVRRHIPFFLAYGKEEQEGSQVKLKKLATSEETTIQKDAVAGAVK